MALRCAHGPCALAISVVTRDSAPTRPAPVSLAVLLVKASVSRQDALSVLGVRWSQVSFSADCIGGTRVAWNAPYFDLERIRERGDLCGPFIAATSVTCGRLESQRC